MFFLGEWCYSNSKIPESSETIKFHWIDRAKYSQDFLYIWQLNERLLDSISAYLNHKNNINMPNKYWRTIIGPWLQILITVIWDRWETVRIAFENFEFDEIISSNFSIRSNLPFDYSEAWRLYQSDRWNAAIYQRIIKHKYSNKIEFIDSNSSEQHEESEYFDKKTRSFRSLFFYFILNLYSKFFKKNSTKRKVLFIGSYFSNFGLLKVLLKLRQLPFYDDKFYENNFKDFTRSEKDSFSFDFRNEFEYFLSSNFLDLLPLAYLEGYKFLLKKSQEINIQSDIIFTANLHFQNELFKVWAAEKTFNKCSKLIISSHGGSFPFPNHCFNIEEEISDKKVVWHTPMNNKCIQLSPSMLCDYKKFIFFRSLIIKLLKKEYSLNIFITEYPRYVMRAISGPTGPLTNEDFIQKLRFIENLDIDIKNKLNVRCIKSSGWNLKRRFQSHLDKSQLINTESVKESLLRSKIVVCNFGTTASEAIYLNKPTIILGVFEHWEIENFFHPLIDDMLKVKMIFFDPKDAANHINQIAKDVDNWWYSTPVERVKKNFLDLCANAKKNYDSEWADFFLKEIGLSDNN